MTQLPDTTTEAGQREASVMLARLCGWLTKDNAFYNYRPPSGKGASVNHKKGYSAVDIFRPIPNGASCPTLYDPANMALAWRVLNWANATKFGGGTTLDQWKWWHNFIADMRQLRPTEAQRAWLDKILTLAIEAGMIEAQP